MTKDEATILVIFNTREDISGTFRGPVVISPQMERFVKYFDGQWFTSKDPDNIDMLTACNLGVVEDHEVCIFGMVLTYHEQNGYLTLSKKNFNLSKESFPSLKEEMMDALVAQGEWPAKNIFNLDTVVGYLPCNVKWSNAMRFDPSNKEGKCLHFTASSKGTIFIIFAAVPNNEDTWYYVQISTYGVGIFKVISVFVLLLLLLSATATATATATAATTTTTATLLLPLQ